MYLEFDIPLVSPEMNIPVVEQFDLQLAYRQEAYSDFEGTGVPRVAFGWRVNDLVKIRGLLFSLDHLLSNQKLP